MANRCPPPNLFAALSPSWSLTSLDQNSAFFLGAFQDASLGYVNGIAADTGTANNYVVTLPFGSPSSYQAGMTVVFNPQNGNTGPSTMTVNPLGSQAIVNPAGLALSGGEIVLSRKTVLVSDGAKFFIVGPCSFSKSFSSTVSQTVDCAGYTSVSIFIQQTSGNCTVTLSHLGFGVPVTVGLQNLSGGVETFIITGTTPGGGAITAWGVVAGGTGGLINLTGSFTLASSAARIFTSAGLLQNGAQIFFT